MFFFFFFFFYTETPSAPGKPDAVKSNGSTVTITWSPPVTDGGSPITNYIIEMSTTDGHVWVRINDKKVSFG